MPQLVASGSFDLAITGVDWLKEHLAKFPSSPVSMAVDLKRSRYSIGPVVHNDFPADTTAHALEIWSALERPIRIASEYPALAEAFARGIQIPRTGIIPINGASEAFVPEDADILIEGTETGASLRANNLKMLDPFLVSTNCLISRNFPITECLGLQKEIVEILDVAAEQNSVT
jgi:ATP phosphoribosyltransferase